MSALTDLFLSHKKLIFALKITKTMKLLLVDDNDRIRKMMKNIYSPHFEEVIECSDGSEAVIAFNDSNPDWVVMDIKMKTMDGIEATKKIISSHPDAKVIIVSQFNDDINN